MAFRMRSSKFRHVFGSPAKKELCYECVRITKNAHDANFCAVNPKFIAIVTESAGGGSFVVLPLDRTGRVDINAPKVCGHSGPVLDIKWNPFNDCIIASCSDDATVKLWEIPPDGLKGNLTEWLVDLHGHQKRVSFIEWHPTAKDILLSAGYDFQCILWNTETAEPINIISVHSDTIFSISWNHDGSLFATTSKDKKIRVIDPREGNIVAEGQGHQGSKASKVVFLGDKNKLFTTGFSRMSERQLAVWEARNLSKPLKMDNVDSSSGVLFPFYDTDNGVVFVAGKGDGNIRYYEITDEAPYVHYLNQYQSSAPQRGLGILPKRGVDPSKCEIVRFYKLHATKGLCEPISMIVPRKSEMFQEDIFPPTASATPSLTADEWISGQNREPILVSLKDGDLVHWPKPKIGKAIVLSKNQGGGSENSGTPDQSHSPVSNASSSSLRYGRPVCVVNKSPSNTSLRSNSSNNVRSANSSNLRTPSLTSLRSGNVTSRANTYNTCSSRSSNISPKTSNTSPRSSSNSSPNSSKKSTNKATTTNIPRPRRDSNSKKDGAISNSPTITTYKAVKRGTSSIIPNTSIGGIGDPRSKRQATAASSPIVTSPLSSGKLPDSLKNIQKLSTNMDDPITNHIKEGKENVNEMINSYEKRSNVVSTASTRLTNANEPMRVDQKTWSATYNSNAAYNNANGMPRTDPEPVTKATPSPRRTSLRRAASESTKDSQARRVNIKINVSSAKSSDTSPQTGVQIREGRPSARGSQRRSLTEGITPSTMVTPPSLTPQTSQRWSAFSDTTDEFHTPPTSPMLQNVISNNATATPNVSEQSSPKWDVADSPKTWQFNPLYGAQQRLPNKTVTASETVSPTLENKRENLENFTRGAKTRTSVRRKSPEVESNQNVDDNYIEMEGFPDDAPDNTLIKPSKLRESLKKRNKDGRPGVDKEQRKSLGDRNNNVEKPVIEANSGITQVQSSVSLRSEQVQFAPPGGGSSSGNASMVQAYRPEKPASPYDNLMLDSEVSTTASNGTNNYLEQAVVDDYVPDNTILTPSKLRESIRRKQRDRANTPDPKDETSQRVHVKKVWSPEPKPAPHQDLVNDNDPRTDPELRKAYFRQLEEIKSLREQISVKDKRIVQLEEEVKHIRQLREMEESTC